MKVWLWLKGKKTFFICVGSLIYAVAGMATSHVTVSDGINIILFSLGGGALRDAINTNIQATVSNGVAINLNRDAINANTINPPNQNQ